MKKTIIFLLLIFTTATFAQKEGQNYCEGDNTEGYFYLSTFNKIVLWFNTYYNETLEGEQVFNNTNYKVYVQEWEDGDKDTLYMREEGSRVLQYHKELDKEVVRFDSNFTLQNKWKLIDCKNRLLSFQETLVTPVCRYKNLMAIEATYEHTTYIFYYLRGFGYVGATKNGQLVSCVVPSFEIIKDAKKRRALETDKIKKEAEDEGRPWFNSVIFL